MHRTSLLILALVGAPLWAQEPPKPDPEPTWPYARRARQERVCDRLEEVKLKANIKQWTLAKTLHTLAGKTRVGLQPDETLDAKAVLVDLQVDSKTSLKRILDHLCKGKPWTWVATDSHVVITRKPVLYPTGNVRYVRQALEKARLLPPMLDSLLATRSYEADMRRKIEKGYAKHRAMSVPARRAPEELTALIGMTVELPAGAVLEGGLRLESGRTKVGDLLEAACNQLRAEWTIHRGKIWLGPRAHIAAKRLLAKQSKGVLDTYLAQIAPMDETLVTVGSKGIRLRDLMADLSRQLGKPIHLDVGAWNDPTLIALPTKKLPFRDVRKIVRDQLGGRVSFVVTDGEALYGVSKPR